MITSFLVIIFFLAYIFFFAEGDKKKYSANKKKLLTNKRSYSSNGNTIIPMIWRFYATNTSYFGQKSEKNITNILQMGGNFHLKWSIYHFWISVTDIHTMETLLCLPYGVFCEPLLKISEAIMNIFHILGFPCQFLQKI